MILKFFLLLALFNLVKNQCDFGYSGYHCDECGVHFNQPNLRIVGGIEAKKNSWPSMAFILFEYKIEKNGQLVDTSRSMCGGTLIDRRTVVTAAHCIVKEVDYMDDGNEVTQTVQTNKFHPTIGSMYKVYLGLHSINQIINGVGSTQGIKMEIDRVVVHPNYTTDTMLDDIAILRFKTAVNFTNTIRPACLPNPAIVNYPTSKNISSWAAGWGTLSSGGSLPDNLQNVKLTLYQDSVCANVAPEVTKNWNKQICAGEIAGGKDTCQGDSGGPLFVRDNVNNVQKFILVGITSYGIGCAEKGLPGIYTKVRHYLPFIFQNSLTKLRTRPLGSNNKKAVTFPVKTTTKRTTKTSQTIFKTRRNTTNLQTTE